MKYLERNKGILRSDNWDVDESKFPEKAYPAFRVTSKETIIQVKVNHSLEIKMINDNCIFLAKILCKLLPKLKKTKLTNDEINLLLKRLVLDEI